MPECCDEIQFRLNCNWRGNDFIAFVNEKTNKKESKMNCESDASEGYPTSIQRRT